MRLPNRWASQLFGFAAWIAVAVLLGVWFGGISWWLVGALGLYVVHMLRNVYLLDRVLQGERQAPTFETRGLWAEMHARVDKIRGKARNRKKKYHRLLREVWDSTGALRDGGIILNAEHEILWFNPAATRLLGLDPARDIGNRLDNLLRHPDFVKTLHSASGEDVTVPSPQRNDEWLAITLIPYGQNQRLAIVRDVTRHMRLETMRRDFVANASHELRSPLTVISGYLDSLQDDDDIPTSWAAPVGEMRRQADRMTQILKDLIELTRLESAEKTARHDFVEVSTLLKQIVAELGQRFEGRTLELHLETDVALLGKEVEIHSIFYNLIHNAVRFTPAGGRVDVHWSGEGDGARLWAADPSGAHRLIIAAARRVVRPVFEARLQQARNRAFATTDRTVQEQHAALDAHRLRHGEQQPIAFDGGDEGQPEPRAGVGAPGAGGGRCP